jgi:arabinose-5-phosphate isomerase
MHIGQMLPFVYEDSKMTEVIEEINQKKLGCAIVINRSNSLKGIITDGDLRRNIGPSVMNLTASDIMKPNPIKITPECLSVEALDIMNSKSITTLIVTEENSSQVAGILHLHDCLRSGASPYLK